MWQIRYWTRDGEGVVKNLTREMAERVATSMRDDVLVWDIRIVEQGG